MSQLITVTTEIWIAAVVLSTLLGCIQIYGYYRFMLISHLRIVQKRYPTFIMMEAIASLIMLFFAIPIWFNSWMGAIPLTNNISSHIINVIGCVLFAYAAHFIINIESLRLWLISFDLNYIHSLSNEQWKSQIDNSFTDKNWYLQNKNKWGNKIYVAKRFLVYYLCAASLSLTTFLLFVYIDVERFHYAQLIDSMFSVAPLSITIYTYYKCPPYTVLNDNFLFYYEFRVTTLIWCIAFVLYPIVQLIHYFGFTIVNYASVIILALWSLSIPSLLSTLWITHKIASKDEWKDDLLKDDMDDTAMIIEMSKSAMQRGDNHNMPIDRQLAEIMKNEEEFDAFVLWMFREFSSESVLSFIEMVQFKRYIMDLLAIHENEDPLVFNLYGTIPESSIIYKEKCSGDIDIARIKRMLHLIYEKYIGVNAEFEINVSSSLRSKYKKWDGDNWSMDITEYVNIFDDLIHQMFLFMIESYVRYKKL